MVGADPMACAESGAGSMICADPTATGNAVLGADATVGPDVMACADAMWQAMAPWFAPPRASFRVPAPEACKSCGVGADRATGAEHDTIVSHEIRADHGIGAHRDIIASPAICADHYIGAGHGMSAKHGGAFRQ